MNDLQHKCRSCSQTGVLPIVSLGRTPLANRLLPAAQLDEAEPTYPLDVVFCPTCALVQITETVPPEELFSEYAYFSSYSDTMIANAESLVARLCRERQLGPESLAVEIASNDGYLLQFYLKAGVPVLGIDPAANVAKVAEEQRGVPTLISFFGHAVARELADQDKRADVIHANNVLAHVADLNGVVDGISILLKPDGVAVIEVPYVREMVGQGEFDTIYHEHLCYFSVTALQALFHRHELELHDVERLSIHGGSLRLFVTPAPGRTKAIDEILAEEAALGMDQFEFYREFGEKVEAIKRELRAMLGDLKYQGRRLAAYGAAAKGATLLNYCEIGTETLDYVVDRSPHKQGLHMPGVHLPVRDPGHLLESPPDYVLLLSWNFADEILKQQAEYRRRGGKFIIPVPEPHVV
jgi:SAM-dependent methyltransferase